MTKYLIVLAVIALSLGNTKDKTDINSQTENSKEFNSQNEMLLGEFEKEDLQQKPYSSWFDQGYENFSPDDKAMAIIKENIGDYDIKLFMGTWCRDSKRETPKFLKILDEAGYNYKQLTMYGVDRSKTTPSNDQADLNIRRVPTMIFYKDGKEVNRFVEYPQESSIEEDIAKIVAGKKYKNSYAD